MSQGGDTDSLTSDVFELLTQFCPEVEQGIRNIYLLIPSSSNGSSIDHSSSVRTNIRKEVIENELKSLRQQSNNDETEGNTAIINKNSSFIYAQLLVEKYIDVAGLLREKLVAEESDLWLSTGRTFGADTGAGADNTSVSSGDDEGEDVVSIMLAGAQRSDGRSRSNSATNTTGSSGTGDRANKLMQLFKSNKGFHYCLANGLISMQICIILSMQEVLFRGRLNDYDFQVDCSYDPYTRTSFNINLDPYSAMWNSFLVVTLINFIMAVLYICRAISKRNNSIDADDGCCYSALFKQGLFLFLDVACVLICLVSVTSAAVAFNKLFKLTVLAESRLYRGKKFPIFMDFSTFFDTFSHSADASYTPCVGTNPTESIRISLILGFCVFFMALLRLRSSYRVVSEIINMSSRGALFSIQVNRSTITNENGNVGLPIAATAPVSVSVSVPSMVSPTNPGLAAVGPRVTHTRAGSIEALYTILQKQLMLHIGRENQSINEDEVEHEQTQAQDLNTSVESTSSNVSHASLALAAPEWTAGMSVKDLLSLYRHYSEHVNTHAQSVLHNITELRLQAVSSTAASRLGGVAGISDVESEHDEAETLLTVYNDYLAQYLDEEVIEVLHGQGKEVETLTLTLNPSLDLDPETGQVNSTGGSSGDVLRDVVNNSQDGGFGGSVAPRASFLVKVRLLCVLFTLATVIIIGSIAETVHLFNGRVHGISDSDLNDSCQFMSNALTSFETPINMQPFAMLWFISLYLFLWCGGVCVYHYLPRNELGEKYIPGMNFALSDVGIFHGQECCGSRYYDTNTNITNWTIFVVCFPLLTDIFLFGLYIGSILWSLVALQRNFGIIFLVASDSYAGSYKIFFDLTSFYRTFTYTEGTYLTSSGTAVYMPRCLSYNPVVSIKLGIGFAVIGFILMCIVIRIVSRSYWKIYMKYQTVKNQQAIRTQQLEMTYAGRSSSTGLSSSPSPSTTATVTASSSHTVDL